MWNESQARELADRLLILAGMTGADLELLRLGNNAVFRVGRRYILRVARPTTPTKDIERELQLANVLVGHGVPVARLADLSVPQPLIVGAARGSLWEYLPGDRPTYRQFGQLVQRFHEQTNRLDLALPAWQPLATARHRLDTLSHQYHHVDIALLEQHYVRIAADLERLCPVLPAGPIHGQAEIGNARLHGHQAVFLDLERVSHGPREWDLIDTAVATLRFALPQAHYEAFANAYGFDVMNWSGFAVLRRLWELRATTWLMQNREHRPEIANEISVRLDSWRRDDQTCRWRGF